MAKPSRGRKDGRGGKKGRGERGKPPYKHEDLIHALTHIYRRQILRHMHSAPGQWSASQIEEVLALGKKAKEMLSNISYHVRVLAEYKAIKLVEEEPVRGSVERYYVSQVSDNALVVAWLEETQQDDESILWPRANK